MSKNKVSGASDTRWQIEDVFLVIK